MGLISIVLFAWTAPAYSFAYCALRDPVNKIYRLFPEATTYRSIVHEIDEKAQLEVKSKVPFSIHQNELGQHTLYIAMNEQTPLGIIHARSEVGLWGLVEIVWAFDFELNVIDFMFQRCRDPACKVLEEKSFRQLLQDKSVAQLTLMLEQENITPSPQFTKDEEIKALIKTIIRSAIKTALVTEYSWHEQLLEFKQNEVE